MVGPAPLLLFLFPFVLFFPVFTSTFPPPHIVSQSTAVLLPLGRHLRISPSLLLPASCLIQPFLALQQTAAPTSFAAPDLVLLPSSLCSTVNCQGRQSGPRPLNFSPTFYPLFINTCLYGQSSVRDRIAPIGGTVYFRCFPLSNSPVLILALLACPCVPLE